MLLKRLTLLIVLLISLALVACGGTETDEPAAQTEVGAGELPDLGGQSDHRRRRERLLAVQLHRPGHRRTGRLGL